jgi:pantoate--beta-alanine ligase
VEAQHQPHHDGSPQYVRSGHDRAALEAAGVALLFAPMTDDMYPEGEGAIARVRVPASLTEPLEGASRPGHFDGVATVVKRLFEFVTPDVAVFGEKDFQQLLVIRWLVLEFGLPVEIIGEQTVREPDGLAMSSRNRYLDAGQRAAAPALFKALTAAAGAIRHGHHDWQILSQRGRTALERAGLEPDYFEVRDADTLGAPADGGPQVVLAAARLGPARLIDNLRV